MSLLWVLAKRMPEVEHVPLHEVLKNYRPTEANTWEGVRGVYEEDHPVMMQGLREDMREKGMLRPVDAFPHWSGGWGINNGHHRILAAEGAGLTHVPIRHWGSEKDIPRPKEHWDPEEREHYEPDGDDDEGQPRY
jgi:hypothetical protein